MTDDQAITVRGWAARFVRANRQRLVVDDHHFHHAGTVVDVDMVAALLADFLGAVPRVVAAPARWAHAVADELPELPGDAVEPVTVDDEPTPKVRARRKR